MLDRPTSGKFILAGRDVAALEDDELSELRNEAIGFVFNLLIYTTAHGAGDIEVPLLYRKHPPSDARERAVELAERVGLATVCATAPMNFPEANSSASRSRAHC